MNPNVTSSDRFSSSSLYIHDLPEPDLEAFCERNVSVTGRMERAAASTASFDATSSSATVRAFHFAGSYVSSSVVRELKLKPQTRISLSKSNMTGSSER